jgi:hypothetical protein
MMKNSSFKVEGVVAKADVFHILSFRHEEDTSERCFLWLGGFRPSELLKVNEIFIIRLFFSVPSLGM